MENFQKSLALSLFIEAGKEEAEGSGHWILHRCCQGVFQHWQLQLPYGHYLWVSSAMWHVRVIISGRSLAWSGINSWNPFPCLAGMNMSPVSRLKKTWGKAKTAKFFILEVNTVQGFNDCVAKGRWSFEFVIFFDSIRWIRQETFTTTGRPWREPSIALRLPTVTEKG